MNHHKQRGLSSRGDVEVLCKGHRHRPGPGTEKRKGLSEAHTPDQG